MYSLDAPLSLRMVGDLYFIAYCFPVLCRCFRGFRCGRGSYCCDCEDCFSSATTANQLRVFVRVRIDFVRFERRVEVVEEAEDEDEEDDDDKAD